MSRPGFAVKRNFTARTVGDAGPYSHAFGAAGDLKVRTTRITGGLLWPYKGLLLAAP